MAGAGITAVAAGGALAARVGVQAERAEVRLRALTDQFGEFNQAQLAATRIAGTLRISQIEAADGLSQLYAALRPRPEIPPYQPPLTPMQQMMKTIQEDRVARNQPPLPTLT